MLAIFREFAERTPGSIVEEKTAGLAWHYRTADLEYGVARAQELSLHVAALLSNVPVEILPRDSVLEVRASPIVRSPARNSGSQCIETQGRRGATRPAEGRSVP